MGIQKQQSGFHAVAETALELLPANGDLDQFIANVSARYGRPIVVCEFDPYDPAEAAPAGVPHGLTGYYRPTASEDRIYVSKFSPPGHRTMILLHELSHLLFLAAMLPVNGLTLASRLWSRAGDNPGPEDDPDEQDAERLGTLLHDELIRRRQETQRHADPRSDRLR